MPIHPTAIINPRAELDPSVDVGPYVIIEDHVRIGAETWIAAHAYIACGTEIGRQNRIYPGAVLGHEPQDLKFDPATVSSLKIGDRNIFRECCTVHRGTDPDSATAIGHDCFLMAGAHVAHNCVLGNHVILTNAALLGGYVHVGDRVFISGGVAVHQFVHIGRLVMLSGNGRFTMDVPPFLLAAERNGIHGLNVVGLKRAGVSAAAVAEIKRLFRLFYRSGTNGRQALEQAQADPTFVTPDAREFIEFVARSPNGICPAAR
ncbi:acyl-ACP--UDP-N-acetylglucosamine O-acyltransferase [bacterium]|nr:acyl-ACP--UDP-N-acetylglucosamine O-acyltransferase [bacterium]